MIPTMRPGSTASVPWCAAVESTSGSVHSSVIARGSARIDAELLPAAKPSHDNSPLSRTCDGPAHVVACPHHRSMNMIVRPDQLQIVYSASDGIAAMPLYALSLSKPDYREPLSRVRCADCGDGLSHMDDYVIRSSPTPAFGRREVLEALVRSRTAEVRQVQRGRCCCSRPKESPTWRSRSGARFTGRRSWRGVSSSSLTG
jgi:hypothetical protein